MEIAVGVSPAMFAAKTARKSDQSEDQDSASRAADRAGRNLTTEHADLASAFDRMESLELELHGPDGELIETESIGLHDTEFLVTVGEAALEREVNDAFADDPEFSMEDLECEDELFSEQEEWSDDCDPEWADEPDKPFARYQIFVQLVDDADVP